MKILVCVKQVCDAETPFSISPDGREIILPFRVTYRMNRYDEHAMEEALRLKDEGIATVIETVSVGPERAAGTLRRSLEMGAHNAYHIIADNDPLSPALIAKLIADFARNREYDLVVTGLMSEDGMNGAVGPMTAANLGYPHATAVMECSISGDRKTITVAREINASTRERFLMRLPAVITVQSGINRPRYPSLSNVLRAKEQKIVTINPAGALAGDFDVLSTLRVPRSEGRAHMIDGDLKAKAAGLYRWLHERSLV